MILLPLLMTLGDSPAYYDKLAVLFKQRCLVCHNDASVDDPETSGRLSLDDPSKWLANPKRKLVEPGKPDRSELFARITSKDAKRRMPKDDEPLSAAEVALVREWIAGGAKLGARQAAHAYVRRPAPARKPATRILLNFNVQAPPKAFGASGGSLTFETPLGPLPPITAVAFSPDGKLLATGAHRRVVVWSLVDAAPVAVFGDAAGVVNGVAFSPDGKLLWTVGGDPSLYGELRAYRTNDWKLDRELGVDGDAFSAFAIRPDGKRLAVVGPDKQLRLFDAEPLREAKRLRAHSDAAFGVAYSKDGQKIATASADKSVKIWSADGAAERTLTGHRAEAFAVLFAADGADVYSGGKDTQLRKTSLGKGNRATVAGAHGIALNQLQWAANYSRFASAGGDNTVRLWRPNGQSERTLNGATDALHSAALSPNGELAAAGGADGAVYLWHAVQGRLLARFYAGSHMTAPAGDWAIVASDGYFQAAPPLLAASEWVVAGSEHPGAKHPPAMHDREAVRAALAGKPVNRSPFAAPPTQPKTGGAPKKKK